MSSKSDDLAEKFKKSILKSPIVISFKLLLESDEISISNSSKNVFDWLLGGL